MTTFLLIVIAALSYFAGNLNGATFLSRLLERKESDILDDAPSLEAYGRIYGPIGVLLILLVDLIKSFAAILLGGLLLRTADAVAVGRLFAGFCLIMGHQYPVLNHYRGRSGLLCGLVMALLIDWRVFLGCLAVFLLMVIFVRYLSLGGIMASLACPVLLWMFNHQTIEGLLALLSALLILTRFAENILNIISGAEPRLQFKGAHSGTRGSRR